MTTKELGRTGVLLPEVGMGTWDYSAGPLPLRKGLEAGALYIDTAESYGTEQVVGKAIRGMRERVFIATKVSPENFRAADLKKALDRSLTRLGLDFVDLLQLHEPNLSIPITETVGALEDSVDAGKVRFFGVSNFSLLQLQEAQKAASKHPIVSNQVRYNIIDRTIEKGLLQYCQTTGVTVIAYSPLGRGLGRIRDCDPIGIIESLSRTTGRSPAQIVINWCLCKDGVVAIPKGSSEHEILDNCGASGWRLTVEQIRQLDANIRYRYRTRFDALVRKALPGPLQAFARRSLEHLPKWLRRRLT